MNLWDYIYYLCYKKELAKKITDRDDRLVVLRNANGKITDLCKKNIISIFKLVGFNINNQATLKIVELADVTFNLENGTYGPFKKPNDKLLYVHASSNNPLQITRQISNLIGERLI